MTVQYAYTQEEHQEAQKNKVVKKQLEKILEKGFTMYGRRINDINEFLLTCLLDEHKPTT